MEEWKIERRIILLLLENLKGKKDVGAKEETRGGGKSQGRS